MLFVHPIWFDVSIHNINAWNNVWCFALPLVINNSLVEKIELVISNDDNNSPKEFKVSNDDDTVSKFAQNSLPWVLPDKYITDRLTIQLILSLLALFSFLPSTNKSLSEKCNVLFSLMSNNSPMNRIYKVRFPSRCQNPVLSISLFSAESGQTSNRKVPCFTNKVLEWYKHVFQIHNFPWWQDQSYSSANYIHCSAKLSVTVHNSHPVELRGWASDFFLEGHHLSKIRLGANVTLIEFFTQ